MWDGERVEKQEEHMGSGDNTGRRVKSEGFWLREGRRKNIICGCECEKWHIGGVRGSCRVRCEAYEV